MPRATRHDVGHANVLPIQLHRRPDGGLTITSPLLPGWGTTVRGAHAIAHAIDAAWNELDVAAYAAGRGTTYDLAHLDPTIDETPPPEPRVTATDTPRPTPGHGRYVWRRRHDPAAWTPLPGGAYRAPSGLVFRAGTQVVQRVRALRVAAGLPVTYADDDDGRVAG